MGFAHRPPDDRMIVDLDQSVRLRVPQHSHGPVRAVRIVELPHGEGRHGAPPDVGVPQPLCRPGGVPPIVSAARPAPLIPVGVFRFADRPMALGGPPGTRADRPGWTIALERTIALEWTLESAAGHANGTRASAHLLCDGRDGVM